MNCKADSLKAVLFWPSNKLLKAAISFSMLVKSRQSSSRISSETGSPGVALT